MKTSQATCCLKGVESPLTPDPEGGVHRWLKKEEYGKVPRYLQNIKVGLAQQHADKQAAKEAAMVPPGMRIMPEEERLEMLGILQESRQDIEAKLQVGPECHVGCLHHRQHQ